MRDHEADDQFTLLRSEAYEALEKAARDPGDGGRGRGGGTGRRGGGGDGRRNPFEIVLEIAASYALRLVLKLCKDVQSLADHEHKIDIDLAQRIVAQGYKADDRFILQSKLILALLARVEALEAGFDVRRAGAPLEDREK